MKKNRLRVFAMMLSAMILLSVSACGGERPPQPVKEEKAEEEINEEEGSDEEEDTEEAHIPTDASDAPELFSWPEKEESPAEFVYTDDDLLSASFYGTVFTFTGEHPNGEKVEATGLKLDEPILIETEYTGRVLVEEVHLAPGVDYAYEDLRAYDGLEVCVGGKGFGGHTGWHFRDLVLPVDWIYELEEYEADGRYTCVDDINLGYYLDVDNLEEALVLLSGRWYADRAYDSDGNVQSADDLKDAVIYYEFNPDGTILYARGKASDADENGELKDAQKTPLTAEFILGTPEDMENIWITGWYVRLRGATYAEGDYVYVTQRGSYLYVFQHGKEDVFMEQLYAKNTMDEGRPVQMSAEELKQANLFLSNFAEQSDGSFSFDGAFHMTTLVDFAFNFARANNPEKITMENDMEVLPLSLVNTYLKRYTSYIIPKAETIYVESDYFYYDDEKIYHTPTQGTEYALLAIARNMEYGRGNIRFIDYDVYELDPVEYRSQGIDKSYYEMTAKEAEKTPSLTKVSRGRAVAEAFYTGTRDSFRLISNESIFTVKNVKELRNAVGNNRIIELEPGTYDLTEDGEELLNGYYGLTIRAARPEDDPVELTCTDPLNNVLGIHDCTGLTLENLVLGHILEEGDCGGDVLYFNGCDDITLTGLDLYGCGAYGINASDCGTISVYDSVIHDCSYGCISGFTCYGFYFCNTTFRDCKPYTMIDLMDSSAYFENCAFYRLEGDFFRNNEESGAYGTFLKCLFDEPILKQLQENPLLGNDLYVTNMDPVG